MLSFIYTYSEQQKPKRNGTTHKTVRIFRIKRNRVVFVAEGTDTYVSEFQLVMQVMEAYRLLPKKAFVRNPMGGWEYCNGWLLKEAGFANVERIAYVS